MVEACQLFGRYRVITTFTPIWRLVAIPQRAPLGLASDSERNDTELGGACPESTPAKGLRVSFVWSATIDPTTSTFIDPKRIYPEGEADAAFETGQVFHWNDETQRQGPLPSTPPAHS